MNKDMTELIWHNLSKKFKNKVDANAIAIGIIATGLHKLF